MIKEKGFSLIELLVVLAILAILVAIAYPAYRNYTIRAACDSGKAGLLQIDGLMNQLRTKYGVYNNTDASTAAAIPAAIPFDGSSSKADFVITIADLTATTYTIEATTVSGGRLSGYSGTLTIDQKGQKGGTLGGKDVWAKGCSAL